MKNAIKKVVAGSIGAALLGLSMSASAGFTGYYANKDPSVVNAHGSVDESVAGAVTVIGGDDDCTATTEGCTTLIQFVAPSSGQVKFDWKYSTADAFPGPFACGLNTIDNPLQPCDPASFFVNAAYTQLAHSNSEDTAATFDVLEGDLFGFYVYSWDGLLGAAQITISAFTGPQPTEASVPEPGTLALLALGLIGVATLRKRQST